MTLRLDSTRNSFYSGASALVRESQNTETSREKAVFGDPLEALWKTCVFDLCGVKNFYRRTFNVIVVSSEEQRRSWLQECRGLVKEFIEGAKPRHANR